MFVCDRAKGWASCRRKGKYKAMNNFLVHITLLAVCLSGAQATTETIPEDSHFGTFFVISVFVPDPPLISYGRGLLISLCNPSEETVNATVYRHPQPEEEFKKAEVESSKTTEIHVTGFRLNDIGLHKGVYILSSTGKLAVFITVKGSGAETVLGIPATAFSTEYKVVTMQGNPILQVICTQDATDVTIDFNLITWSSTAANVPDTPPVSNGILKVTLKRYDVYQYSLCTTGNVRDTKDFTGASVRSTKPVGVLSGNCVSRSAGPKMGHFKVMLAPASTWGETFLVALPAGAQSSFHKTVFCKEKGELDYNEVNPTKQAPPTSRLSFMEVDHKSNDITYIKADGRAQLALYWPSKPGRGAQGRMVVLPAVENWLSYYLVTLIELTANADGTSMEFVIIINATQTSGLMIKKAAIPNMEIASKTDGGGYAHIKYGMTTAAGQDTLWEVEHADGETFFLYVVQKRNDEMLAYSAGQSYKTVLDKGTICHNPLIQSLHTGYKDDACINGADCSVSLLCREGACNCEENHYYDTQDKLCKHRGDSTFRQLCTRVLHCAATLTCMAYRCLCNRGHHFDDVDYTPGQCMKDGSIGAPCRNRYMCAVTMRCENNVCDCSEDQFFNQTSQSCKWKASIGGPCQDSEACRPTLICINNSTCNCTGSEFFDRQTGMCDSRYPHGHSCTIDDSCIGNLACLGGKCSCLPGTVFDPTQGICVQNVFACSVDSDCKVTSMLCVDSTCTCPVGQYLAERGCTLQKGLGKECDRPGMCKDTLECIKGVCLCDDVHFYDTLESLCQERKTKGQACLVNGMCLKSFECQDGTCQCPVRFFYDSSRDACVAHPGAGQSSAEAFFTSPQGVAFTAVLFMIFAALCFLGIRSAYRVYKKRGVTALKAQPPASRMTSATSSPSRWSQATRSRRPGSSITTDVDTGLPAPSETDIDTVYEEQDTFPATQFLPNRHFQTIQHIPLEKESTAPRSIISAAK